LFQLTQPLLQLTLLLQLLTLLLLLLTPLLLLLRLLHPLLRKLLRLHPLLLTLLSTNQLRSEEKPTLGSAFLRLQVWGLSLRAKAAVLPPAFQHARHITPKAGDSPIGTVPKPIKKPASGRFFVGLTALI
jgi:hypothetical protein